MIQGVAAEWSFSPLSLIDVCETSTGIRFALLRLFHRLLPPNHCLLPPNHRLLPATYRLLPPNKKNFVGRETIICLPA